jgi:hypothetical protein
LSSIINQKLLFMKLEVQQTNYVTYQVDTPFFSKSNTGSTLYAILENETVLSCYTRDGFSTVSVVTKEMTVHKNLAQDAITGKECTPEEFWKEWRIAKDVINQQEINLFLHQ